MTKLISLNQFLDLASIEGEKINPRGITERIFGDVDKVFDHYDQWLRIHSDETVKKDTSSYMTMDEYVAISCLAGSLARGNISYWGSGSGIYPYTAAKFSQKKVTAFDNSDEAIRLSKCLEGKFGNLTNILFIQSHFKDIVDKIEEGDMIFGIHVGDFSEEMIQTAKDKKADILFSHDPTFPLFISYTPRDYYELVKKFSKQELRRWGFGTTISPAYAQPGRFYILNSKKESLIQKYLLRFK